MGPAASVGLCFPPVVQPSRYPGEPQAIMSEEFKHLLNDGRLPRRSSNVDNCVRVEGLSLSPFEDALLSSTTCLRSPQGQPLPCLKSSPAWCLCALEALVDSSRLNSAAMARFIYLTIDAIAPPSFSKGSGNNGSRPLPRDTYIRSVRLGWRPEIDSTD